MKNVILYVLFFSLFSTFHVDAGKGSSPETAFAASRLKQDVCNNLSQFEGWCTKEKALNFIDLVLDVKPQVCVEIGVFGGASIYPVAAALKFLDHGVVYGIDPWDKAEVLRQFDPVTDLANIVWWQKLNFTAIHNSYKKSIKKYELDNFCITLKMTSKQAAEEIDTIDILYIDGGHSEEAFVSDVSLYLPKVVSGGYIWMNDTLWEQSQLAIELLLEQCEVVKLIDNGNCILFKKR